MKQEYRVSSWRHDVPRKPYKTFETEGGSLEECDEKAKEIFRNESEKKENSWNGMGLERIDTPAVAEKTTHITDNGRQSGDMDWQL